MKLLGIHRIKPGAFWYPSGSPVQVVELHLCWFDFWVGWFWDRRKRILWVCPLPMLAVRIQLKGARKP